VLPLNAHGLPLYQSAAPGPSGRSGAGTDKRRALGGDLTNADREDLLRCAMIASRFSEFHGGTFVPSMAASDRPMISSPRAIAS
jgi:hypothetical protein